MGSSSSFQRTEGDGKAQNEAIKVEKRYERNSATDNGADAKGRTIYQHNEEDELAREAPVCTEKVGQFASTAFKLGITEEAVALFMADEEGRQLFNDFIKTRLTGKRRKDITCALQAIIDINTENHAEEKFLEAIRPILEMKLFESFLSSQYFEEWLRRNQQIFKTAYGVHEQDEDLGPSSASTADDSDTEWESSINSQASSVSSRHSTVNSMALSALNVIGRQGSVIFTVNNKSWLSSMLAAVEFIPLAFTIALADEVKGFPLMYVNNAFEKLTGYKKKDCLGKSCSFLQTNPKTGEKVYSSSDTVIQDLSRAIMFGCPYSARLNNFKANGDLFMNRLQLQPLYDQRMTYRFVIGLQLEVDDSMEDKSAIDYENEKLMSLLPKFFYDEGSKDKDAAFFAEMFG